jgi:membrane protease YdiL (CAAX protease family)
MDEEKLKYYKLARYPVYEVIMEGQIASAGAHQAKLIEKFKKNKKYIKHQYLALKFVFAFLFVFLPLFPLIIFLQSAEIINEGTHSINTVFFISSFSLMIFFGMVLLYVLMLGLITTSSFMSGNAFKWLQTLPFSKNSLKKLGIMTLFRNLDIPLIILIAGFPVITFIATQDIFTFLISIPVSIVSVIFSFSILVIVGEKMSYLFSESKSKSKRATIVRTITMLGYFILMFATGFLFSMGMQAVDTLFDIFSTTEPPFVLIMILSLIPFLFAPAFLVALPTLQFQVHPILILTTITGFALTIIFTWVLFKTAQKALHSAISTEIKTEKVEERDIKFEIISTTPIKAYIRKDLVSSTRDIQSFMFVFFPLFYPLIMIFSMFGLFNTLTFSPIVILMVWVVLLLFYIIIPIMLVVGFFNIEESGSSTSASLPIIPRDQAKAKLLLMSIIQGLSLVIASVTLTFLINSVIVIVLLLVSLPIAWTFLLLIFLMKIKLFGQMKYKYVIEEINKRNKPLKWVAMISSLIGLYLTIVITGAILLLMYDIIIMSIVLGVIGLLGLAILIFAFIRMFPRLEIMPYYKTGGFLREHINITTLVLLILYFIFLTLANNVFYLVLPMILSLNSLLINFIQFFIIVGFLILLWQIIVPYSLKLPNGKESFIQHTQSIGLSKFKPLWSNIGIGIGAIIMFGFSTVLIGEIFGDYIFVGNFFLIGGSWFLFIFMLIPGIWEEVSFRGVILNLQSKRYKKTTVILLNGVLFGLFHFTNALGGNFMMVVFQVIYASCLGISFAYMFFKTRSLLPCIITHYLVDSLGQIFFTNTLLLFPINITLNLALFLILGIGVLPLILNVIMVKLIVNDHREHLKRILYGFWFITVVLLLLLFMLFDGSINLIILNGPLNLLIIAITTIILGPFLIELFIKRNTK